MNRREWFSSLTGGTAVCEPVSGPCGGNLIPNATLRTHDDVPVRFYDDVIRGKQVVINMMYATCEGQCPAITAQLVKVHETLKGRMGKDLFMYSISMKPEVDNPAALKSFAEMHGALLPGWTFLTGDAYDIETIRYRLFGMDHIKFDMDLGMHTSMLRIINDATNCWTCVTPLASVRTVVQHISWADLPKSFAQRMEDNRKLQREIDAEVKLYGYRKIV